MPIFKTTYNILTKYDEDELFNPNWMDSDKLVLPPKKDWDYKEPLKLENVNIWEVLYEESNGVGVYAAYDPYAEFYLITTGFDRYNYKVINEFNYYPRYVEEYYGKNAQKNVIQRMKDLNIPFSLKKIWVDPDKMWLYSD